MKNISIVILYAKELFQSETLLSILSTGYCGDLVIFNNGPKLISNDCELYYKLKKVCDEIYFIQELNNKPLSMIYNEFLNRKGYDCYFIFDDDTCISPDFFQIKNDILCNLSLPVVLSSKKKDISYPIINGKPYHGGDNYLKSSEDILSIGSGLMIHISLINIFQKNEISLFDERFALYGVDYSLFRRISEIKKKNIHVDINISSQVIHSLSSECGHIFVFRERERLIDLILTKMFYLNKSWPYKVLSIGKTFFEMVVARKFYNALLIILVVYYREHPRVRVFKNYKKSNE